MNSGDPADRIQQYFAENKFTFKTVMGGKPSKDGKSYEVFNLFGVQAYPTNYIVDSEGKVVYRDVGFNEQAIRSALEKLGVK